MEPSAKQRKRDAVGSLKGLASELEATETEAGVEEETTTPFGHTACVQR